MKAIMRIALGPSPPEPNTADSNLGKLLFAKIEDEPDKEQDKLHPDYASLECIPKSDSDASVYD